MATSFQKKSRSRVIQIPGAKPSVYNNQLLISTGIPSLDQIMGGGLAAGTVLMIEEDTYGSYARVMLKYFCSEAVMTGHALLLASADLNPKQLLTELPGPIVDDPAEEPIKEEPIKEEASDSDGMKIAWRYRYLPKFQSNQAGIKFGHYYDLTKSMETDLINTVDVTTVSGEDLGDPTSGSNDLRYSALLQKIQDHIHSGGFGTAATKEKRNILRIAIHSLGSPLWGENGGLSAGDVHDPALPKFLLGLRVLLRSAFAVCVLTVPTHLFCDKVFVRRVERLCDTVIHLESFVGSDKEKNPVYKEHHGLLNIVQLPRLNSLVCHMPDSLDLAFKLRRKKFTIEKLHLPPELSETASRPQEDPVPILKPSAGSCGVSTGTSKLDF